MFRSRLRALLFGLVSISGCTPPLSSSANVTTAVIAASSPRAPAVEAPAITPIVLDREGGTYVSFHERARPPMRGPVRAIAWSDSGQELAAAVGEPKEELVGIWDSRSGKLVRSQLAPGDPWDVAFVTDETVATSDGELLEPDRTVWPTARIFMNMRWFSEGLRGLRLDDDGSFSSVDVSTGDSRPLISAADAALLHLEEHSGDILVEPKERWMVSITSADEPEAEKLVVAFPNAMSKLRSVAAPRTTALRMSRDGTTVVTANGAGEVQVRDLPSLEQKKACGPFGENSSYPSIQISADARYLSYPTGEPLKHVVVVDLSSCASRTIDTNGSVEITAFSPDARRLAVGDKTGTITIWSVR